MCVNSELATSTGDCRSSEQVLQDHNVLLLLSGAETVGMERAWSE